MLFLALEIEKKHLNLNVLTINLLLTLLLSALPLPQEVALPERGEYFPRLFLHPQKTSTCRIYERTRPALTLPPARYRATSAGYSNGPCDGAAAATISTYLTAGSPRRVCPGGGRAVRRSCRSCANERTEKEIVRTCGGQLGSGIRGGIDGSYRVRLYTTSLSLSLSCRLKVVGSSHPAIGS